MVTLTCDRLAVNVKKSRSGLRFCSRRCGNKSRRLGSEVDGHRPAHYGTKRRAAPKQREVGRKVGPRCGFCPECQTPCRPKSRCTAHLLLRKGHRRVDGVLRVTESLTRDEVFASTSSKNYPWHSARSSIQRRARSQYLSSTETPSCFLCGYTKIVDACHIVGVMDVEGSTTLEVINSPNNLVGLCPNCRREYDRDLLDPEALACLDALAKERGLRGAMPGSYNRTRRTKGHWPLPESGVPL